MSSQAIPVQMGRSFGSWRYAVIAALVAVVLGGRAHRRERRRIEPRRWIRSNHEHRPRQDDHDPGRRRTGPVPPAAELNLF